MLKDIKKIDWELTHKYTHLNKKYLHKIEKEWAVLSVAAFTFAGGVSLIQQPKVEGTDAEETKVVASAPSTTAYRSMITKMHAKQSELTNSDTTGNATNNSAAATTPVKDNLGLIHPGNIPAGVPLSDFLKTYNRVIHYKDAENPNGPDIAPSATQPVSLVRWATYDYTTNKVVGWGRIATATHRITLMVIPQIFQLKFLLFLLLKDLLIQISQQLVNSKFLTLNLSHLTKRMNR